MRYGILLLSSFAAALCFPAPDIFAEAPVKTKHVGYLVWSSYGARASLEQSPLDGMREEGYVEGKNLVVERGYIDGNNYEEVRAAARELVEIGGLMSYGPNLASAYRQSATYVDKVLTGTKPANLPVEQPRRFEFVVNPAAAKALGVTVPQDLVLRADDVIR